MENQPLDNAILAALPEGAEVISFIQHGNTNWSTGYRIDVHLGEDEKAYFLKIIEREELVGMAESEYEGQSAIFNLLPGNSVKPVAWGYLENTQSKSWFLAEYRDLRARTPPLKNLLPIVKRMHQSSVSPTGKFGFHVTAYYGPPPMIVDWSDNWEEFWIREFRSGLQYVQRMCGDDAELMELGEEFIEKVAVRLLRPLQTGGRNIKPSLCHGDLWDGNIQIDIDTQEPVIFDPCAFYGHHEMDFQCMQSPRYKVGVDFIELYKKEIGASHPIADFDDRVSLYAVRNDLMTASMWPHWVSLVDKAKEEMRRMVAKHPNGLAGFEGSLEPTKSTKAASSEDSVIDSGIDTASDSGSMVDSGHASMKIEDSQKLKHKDVTTKRPSSNVGAITELSQGTGYTSATHAKDTSKDCLAQRDITPEEVPAHDASFQDDCGSPQSDHSDSSYTTTNDMASSTEAVYTKPYHGAMGLFNAVSRFFFGS